MLSGSKFNCLGRRLILFLRFNGHEDGFTSFGALSSRFICWSGPIPRPPQSERSERSRAGISPVSFAGRPTFYTPDKLVGGHRHDQTKSPASGSDRSERLRRGLNAVETGKILPKRPYTGEISGRFPVSVHSISGELPNVTAS